MSLIRHTKMIRPATAIACICILTGTYSVASGAIAALDYQDRDDKRIKVIEIEERNGNKDENVEVIVIGEGESGHQQLLKKLRKEHNIEIAKILDGQDEDIEIVVVGDEGSDHKELLKKLKKKHKIDIKELHGAHGGEVEVVVIEEDEQHGDIEKLIHGHVVELLHGHGPDKDDRHEMANQLRRIADRLDGKTDSGSKKHRRHKDAKILHEGIHGLHVWKHTGGDHEENEDVEIVTGGGKKFQFRKSGNPRGKMIIEYKPEGNAEVHELHGDHKRLLLHRAQDHDKSINVFVEKMAQNEEEDEKLQIEDVTTSDESDWSKLEKLKTELDALRDELRQLRSKRPDNRKQRPRRKKDQSSLEGKGDTAVWVAKDGTKSFGNTFVWKTADPAAEQDRPSRFRFEFKENDADKQ